MKAVKTEAITCGLHKISVACSPHITAIPLFQKVIFLQSCLQISTIFQEFFLTVFPPPQWIVQVVAKMTASLVFCLSYKESKRREFKALLTFCPIGQQHSVSFTGCWGMWESPLSLIQHETRLTLWLFPSAHSSLQPANYRVLWLQNTHTPVPQACYVIFVFMKTLKSG